MTPMEERLDVRRYDGEVQLHVHDYHQVVLPLNGVMDMEIGGRCGLVAAGRGAFIAANASHAFRAPPANRFVVADLPATVQGGSGPWADLEHCQRPAFFTITPPIQSLIDYLTATVGEAPASPAMSASWCRLLAETLKGPSGRPAAAGEAIVERATAFMRAHLARPITVTDIARASGASATRLHDLFRKRTGGTPHGRLAELRLDAAMRLLTTTTLPIAEIAVRTGHADQSALTRKLRLSHGVTPAAMRRGERGGACGADA